MDSKLLGSRIKSRRIELDLTQGDIASSIGVAVSTIQRYETGSIQKIKLPVVEAIARCLHVNANWLVGKSEYKEPATKNIESNEESTWQLDIFSSFLDFKYDYNSDPECRLTQIPQDMYAKYSEHFNGDKMYIWAAYMAKQNDVSDEFILLNALALETVRRNSFERAYEKIYNHSSPPYRLGQKKTPEPAATDSRADDEEWLTNLLIERGYIKRGEDISDRDAEFLIHIIGILDAWFDK